MIIIIIIKPVNEIPHNGGVRMKRGAIVENQRAAGRQGGHLLYLTPLIIIVIIVIIMVIIIGKPKWWNCLAIMMIKMKTMLIIKITHLPIPHNPLSLLIVV